MTNSEIWRVQLTTGEVRIMSLDELDRAFDAGYIHARTNVLAPGSFHWTTLGEAAGLEDPQPEQTPSLSPMAIASGGPSSYSFPQIPQQSGLSMQSFGVDDDAEFAPRRKRGLVFGFVIAAAAAACAFAVTTGRLGGSFAGAHHDSAAAALAPAVEQKLPAAAMPVPQAEPKKEEAKPAGLAEDLKKKLLDADKDRDAKLKAKAEKAGKGLRRRLKGSANGSSEGASAKDSAPLPSSGDKFDPLNGGL